MDTREKIIATAADLFRDEGVRATGLAKILEVSQTPKGSLYYYFPKGKSQLIEAAIAYAGQHICQRVQTALDRAATPVEALTGQLAEMAANMRQHGSLSSYSISLIALETSDDPQLQAACAVVFAQLAQLYAAKLIEAGVADEQAQRLGQFIQSTIEGSVIIATTKQEPDLLDQAAVQLAQLIKLNLTTN